MKISILTIFPEYFDSPLGVSILKRASEKAAVEFEIINIRDFASDKHQTTDDRPFGGGPGMVMKVEPIDGALQFLLKKAKSQNRKILLTSAKGVMFTQQKAIEYSQCDELVIVCGHYEGVDERVAAHLIDEEVRIGDYVLTGGEAAAVVIADAIARLIPGVLGNELSNVNESHSRPGQLGFPQYTRPSEYRGWKVPEILLTGHEANIAKWRKDSREDGDENKRTQ